MGDPFASEMTGFAPYIISPQNNYYEHYYIQKTHQTILFSTTKAIIIIAKSLLRSIVREEERERERERFEREIDRETEREKYMFFFWFKRVLETIIIYYYYYNYNYNY